MRRRRKPGLAYLVTSAVAVDDADESFVDDDEVESLKEVAFANRMV